MIRNLLALAVLLSFSTPAFAIIDCPNPIDLRSKNTASKEKSLGKNSENVKGQNKVLIRPGCDVPTVRAPSIPRNIVGPATNTTGSFKVTFTRSVGFEYRGTIPLGYYVLQQSINGGAYSNAKAPDIKASSFSLTGKTNAVYRYRMKACNRDIISNREACSSWGYSNNSEVRIKPATPPRPTSLNSVSSSYTVSWPAVKYNATYYSVQERSAGGNWSTISVSQTKTSIFRKGKANNSNWEYRVRACNTKSWACSTYSGVSAVKVYYKPSIPSAPSNPSTSNGSVTVSWSKPSGNVSYYNIQKRVNNGGWSSAATSVSSTSKAISGLSDGNWEFRVQACNSYSWSCSAYGTDGANTTVRAKPNTPGKPVAPGSDNDGSYTISWSKPAGNVTYYDLQERRNSAAWSTIQSGKNVTSKAISGKSTGTYNYRVRACNSYSWACSSYGTISTTNVSINVAPVANAGSDKTINESSSVSLDGSGSDSDGTISTYRWTQVSGTSVSIQNSTSASARFTAPSVTANTTLKFRLTITDNDGATDSDDVSIVVRQVNQLPVANAGSNKSANENTSVTLSGSGTDSDGSIASYSWSQIGGTTVTISNRNSSTASFNAPEVTTNSNLTFRLTVTDNNGGTDTDDIIVTIRHVNKKPTANAGSNKVVNESSSVTLTGHGSDPDGSINSFKWTQVSGVAVSIGNSTSASANFTAPSVSSNSTLVFRLTVTDNSGATDTDDVSITVNNVNVAPIANAGSDKSANEGTSVSLSGGGTDSDGTITSFSWQQLSGASVSIVNASSANASFVAPDVNTDSVFGFRLTVTDNNGATNSDDVNVTIRNTNQLPTVNAGVDQTVVENSTVVLQGTASDQDGTISSYKWTQTSGPTVNLASSNSNISSFEVPHLTESTVYQFRLTVTDNSGGTAHDSVVVTATNNVTNPVVDAGDDYTASYLSTDTAFPLEGIVVSNQSQVIAVEWTQVSGPVVSIVDKNSLNTYFHAGEIANSNETVEVTMKLSVEDSAHRLGTDTISVTMTPNLPEGWKDLSSCDRSTGLKLQQCVDSNQCSLNTFRRVSACEKVTFPCSGE